MKRYNVLTLFPETVTKGMSEGVTGRAFANGLASLNAVNIRDYSADKHRKADDYPYGGGAGMLMSAQPIYDAYLSLNRHHDGGTGKDLQSKVIFVTPSGKLFDQATAKEWSELDELTIICGQYEGVDERVLEVIVTDYVSIGDYVLSGGELAAMVIIDACLRLVPGVLGNNQSAVEESYTYNLLEYPQYTRPAVWRGKRVPDILLSGDHNAIEQWRLEQSIKKTYAIRPDLIGRPLKGGNQSE